MENPKFNLLNESLKAIKKGSLNLLCVRGEPGTGKSRTILNFLNENKVNYNYFSSYTTPLSFYNLIYQNQDKEVLVFDDIEGISDLKVIAMLKGLCWSPDNQDREINYFSTSETMDKLGLPDKITTRARIILIFNNVLRGFDAVINRGLMIDFNFSYHDKINIFNEMRSQAQIDGEVLEWVKLNCNESTENLSLRSLVILSNLKRDSFDFKLFAKEILRNDEETRILLEILKKFNNTEDACNEWIKIIGKSRRTFFRLKKRLNL